MVYGYGTNKEFIDKTQILLDKLEKKGVWDKDTLIIGLDKSVRPLAYTIRKLSKEEGKDTPDIKFFNYSSKNYTGSESNKIASHLKKRLDPKKLSHYKKVLILDEYTHSGATFVGAQRILEDYFSSNKDKPDIYKATLISSNHAVTSDIEMEQKAAESNYKAIKIKQHLMKQYLNDSSKELVEIKKREKDQELKTKRLNELAEREKEKFIYADNKRDSSRADSLDSGIKDKYPKEIISESTRVSDKEIYKEFVQNRKKLSNDINQYLKERNEDNESSPVGKSLEKAVQTISVISFFGGIILSYKSITGNIIGSSNSVDILGVALIILGILGLFIFRKFNK